MINGIDTEKIVPNSFMFTKQEPDMLTIYDRYELKFSLKSGEEKLITLYTDKGTIPDIIPNEYIGKEKEFKRKIKEFILGTLCEIRKSESRVYLGSFNYKDNSKPVNDTNSISKDGFQSKQNLFDNLVEVLELYENGKITYEEFMETFPELTEKQEVKESDAPKQDKAKDFRSSLLPDNYDKENTPTIGKHYVLGDIHGYKEPYDTVFKMIKPEDSIVLLGDVVDRGSDGIDILQDLIRRKANTPESNITFILGNHEKMMFDAINYILRLHLSPKIISDINSCYNANSRKEKIYEYYNESGNGDIELAEELGRLCENIKEDIKKTLPNPNVNVDKVIKDIGVWCNYKNGGDKTLNSFMSLSENEQKGIHEFLRTSYIMKQQNIQGKEILFVHSRPPQDISLVKGLKQSKDGGIRASDVPSRMPEEEFNFVVWNRDIDTYSPCKKLGLETICGHEYKFNTTIVNRQEGYTRLDEGCGHGDAFSVGLYCIEDNSVMHIGQDDKVFKTNSTGKIQIIDKNGKEETIEGTKIPKLPTENVL